eukprot:GHVL01035275.1.p1 GENE.GHVL01035275.1~~GHVL01035275.1.p1  ORF type:complete len:489 (+),score=108.11 GHVL01035275.1:37-1503(+)
MTATASAANGVTAVVVSPNPSAAVFGVVYPPADVRAIIDKAAEHVARNGPAFEARMIKDQTKFKFPFLDRANPYWAYYDAKVKEFKGEAEVTKPEVPQAIQEMRKREEEKKKKIDEVKMLTHIGEQAIELKEPDPDVYSVAQPYITPLDMDIIKTTAQFVARNGRKFLLGLDHRENRNPQFDFLKPTHVLFQYFSQLVDAYTQCLLPSKPHMEKLKATVAPQTGLTKTLQRCTNRYRWEEKQRDQSKQKEQELEDERVQLASVDWHDFVVVETIVFTDADESVTLATPLTIGDSELPVPLSAQSHNEWPGQTSKAPTIADDMDLDIEEDDKKQAIPRATPFVPLNYREYESNFSAVGGGSSSFSEESITIRKDYVRKPKGNTLRDSSGRKLQKCPITGLLIPEDEMSKHLRVVLLDPKWKQQKDSMIAKAQKESAFATAETIEDNLANFVMKRPDLFGSVEDQIGEEMLDIGSNTGVGPPGKRARTDQ